MDTKPDDSLNSDAHTHTGKGDEVPHGLQSTGGSAPTRGDKEQPRGTTVSNRNGTTTAKPPSREEPADLFAFHVSRTLVNFWLDAALLVVLCALGITGVIVYFVFPPGIAARGWTLWGMSYGKWSGIQFALLCSLGAGVLIHVMLHWNWICGVIARRLLKRNALPDDGIRTLYGVGFLIVLLNIAGAIIAAATWMITEPH